MKNELKFDTNKSPILFEDKEYGIIELIANVKCNYIVNNNNLNLKKLKSDLQTDITSLISDIFDEKKGVSYTDVLIDLTEKLNETMKQKYQTLGVEIEKIDYSINLSESSNKKIDNILKEKNSDRKKDTVTVVETGNKIGDGQSKCPKCGATDISTNTKNGKLRCNFCRHEFTPEKVDGMVTDINQLQGQIMGSGAQDIIADTKDVLTFKCSSCGAEVVVDTASSMNARCHWCRNILSVNEQIPNGAVPDVVLAFNVSKEDARRQIETFVGKRKFFAHPKFRQEFTTENIMGVYFPYMLVDVNAHANFVGEGEHETRSYTVKVGDRSERRYDADVYHVEREFDIAIHGLSIESNSDRLNNSSSDKTNNIINSIMPFDIENCVKYNANYLKGYTSEKRDVNIDNLRLPIANQAKDIARYAANDTLKHYDRGVAWSNEGWKIKGQQWQAAYLPVWLYSYQEVKGNKKLLHYVAVNARTKETMGSIPIHMPKLLGISFLVELLAGIAVYFVDFDYNWIFLFAGFIYFFIMYSRYRNSGARHKYEKDTKNEMSNLRSVDKFLHSERGLTSSTMSGANNRRLNGTSIDKNLLNSLSQNKVGSNIANGIIDSNPLASFVKSNIDKNGDNK